MPNLTPNYGLKKPLPSEGYDVNIPNENADITDAAIKAANDIASGALPKAGGTMTGATAYGRNEVQQPKLKDYSEVVKVIAAATGAMNLSIADGNVFDVTLTGAFTPSFTNPAASGQACSFTIILRQGATPYAVTWPASVKWIGDAIPTISDASKTVILTFITVNGGTRWYGMAATKFTT